MDFFKKFFIKKNETQKENAEIKKVVNNNSQILNINEKSITTKTIDTNIQQLSSDEDIKTYLSQKQDFREIYEALIKTSGTQLYAQLLGSCKNKKGIIATEVYELIVIVKYESPNQYGQWDLFIIQKPISKETNFYKVVSYLETCMDKNMDDIIEYLREEIQIGIGNDIKTERKVTLNKTYQIIMDEYDENSSTKKYLLYFSI